jgi:hypothetical protein
VGPTAFSVLGVEILTMAVLEVGLVVMPVVLDAVLLLDDRVVVSTDDSVVGREVSDSVG